MSALASKYGHKGPAYGRHRRKAPMLLAKHLPFLLFGSGAWAVAAGLFVVPPLKEAMEQAAQVSATAATLAMIPAPCDGFDQTPEAGRCWITLDSFRRLFPELAAMTDLNASAQRPHPANPEEAHGPDWRGVAIRAAGALGPLLLVLLKVGTWRSRPAARPMTVATSEPPTRPDRSSYSPAR